MTATISTEALLRNTSDGAAVVGPDGRITFWNKAAEDIFNRPASDVVGRHCWSIFGGCDVHGNRVCMSPCSVRLLLGRGERVRHFKMSSMTRQGDAIWLDISTLRDPGGAGRPACIVHLFRDVTADYSRVAPSSDTVSARQQTGAEIHSREQTLTAREREIMELLRTGATTEGIAEELGIRRTTVRNHVQNIFSKLGVHSRLAAVTQVAADKKH